MRLDPRMGIFLLGCLFLFAIEQTAGAADWQSEWQRILEAAKKEGTVVAAIPPSQDFRKELEAVFQPKFGIVLELVPARGAQNAQRIVSEYKAGVSYFDLFFAGSGVGESLAHGGMLDPLEPHMILPEVKDPKNWWGGHIWEDNVKTNRYLYSFVADAGTGALWINAEMAKEEELRSFDDLLQPKWKGKIAFLDPRNPGPGDSIWSFLWDKKGEDYLRKLVAQELFLSTDYRQITDALAKGRVAISIGPTRHQYEPYIKAGLPVKELATPKEGLPTSNGFGTIGILKNAPHPNATKVFLNWFLGREGQELFSRAMAQATRRADVDTKWMAKIGTRAAKDVMSVEDYHRLRNHLEDQVIKVRIPAMKFAQGFLK